MHTESTQPVILRLDFATSDRANGASDCELAEASSLEQFNCVDTDLQPECPARMSESIIQVINQHGDTSRLVVVRVDDPDQPYLVLRQQDWADGIGWYTQRSVEIGSEQLGPLRCTLQACQDCQSGPIQLANRNKKQLSAARRQRLKIVS